MSYAFLFSDTSKTLHPFLIVWLGTRPKISTPRCNSIELEIFEHNDKHRLFFCDDIVNFEGPN